MTPLKMKVVNPVGKLGEDLACEYLLKNNYTIVERNFHAKGGEIDIIAIETAKNQKTLCFIEVKTRTTLAFGTPFEAISFWKLKAMQKTAIYYTILHKSLPKALRLDAVGVILSGTHEIVKIEHLKNITE
ncbi:MAG: YraN family protein [Candidatus Levybacteria bacterium]|nr:YraN family protein [Candidatus Levybacteria bacterium]